MNQIPFKVKGMQRDLAESSFNSQYAYEIKNMRIMATNDNTLMSLVNEKGPKQLPITWHDTPDNTTNYFLGDPIGQVSIGDYYVLFTTTNTPTKQDYIYKFWFEKDINNNDVLHGKTLSIVNLGFDKEYPIETLGYYENEGIQKVYWVDGINQPRFINIAVDNNAVANINSEAYDFTVNLELTETINITKTIASNGVFSSGVIQYAFTYFNKYGQESNIFRTTPLEYISFGNRGASPEESVSNGFNIQITNSDTNFDYVRIYSIYRTSINATPVVKRLIDIKTDTSPITYIDRGIDGDIIDPKLLLYIGGEKIIAGTLNQKDNTLFLGNLKIERPPISNVLKTQLKSNSNISFTSKSLVYQPQSTGTYPYTNSLNYSSSQNTTLKQREWYRFGVIFQHKTGKWSDVVWLGDSQNNVSIGDNSIQRQNNSLVQANVTINNNNNALTNLIAAGYIRAKGVIVYPTIADRTVICQGIINPTVYNAKDRFTNSPFAQSSWFTRPMAGYNVSDTNEPGVSIMNNELDTTIQYGAWAEFRHNEQLPENTKRNAEIQNISNNIRPYIDSDSAYWVNNNKHRYYVDQSIVTLHSPDIEFDDQLKYIDMSTLKLRIVGTVPITGSQMDIDVQTSSTSISGSANSFYNEFTEVTNDSIDNKHGFKGIVSGAMWHDRLYKPVSGTLTYGFPIYPWHRSGSLTNASNPADNETLPAVLSKKKMSNLRFSSYTKYSGLWTPVEGNVSPVIFDSSEMSLIKLDAPLNSGLGNIYYYGNIDNISYTPSPYPITYTTGTTSHYLFVNAYSKLNSSISNVSTASDPIRIKYKSTPHAVIAFNYTSTGQQVILPSLQSINLVRQPEKTQRPFWKTSSSGVTIKKINYYSSTAPTLPQNNELWCDSSNSTMILKKWGGNSWIIPEGVNIGDKYYFDQGTSYLYFTVTNRTPTTYLSIDTDQTNIVINQAYYPYNSDGFGALYIGELYRPTVTNRFGGTSESALNNNIWVPAGPTVKIVETGVNITYNQGDTYFQRYDHLKTYPFTMEDTNSVTDIVSFMVETRVNIDGRYDKNRGNKNNLTTTPNNFNLLNPVYNQIDNFFVYRPLSSTVSTESYFPNSITWSLTKSSASLTDAWTNITMASVLDLDGDKGGVNVIKRYNNELIAFQNKGVSNILFNSRTQITATDGVPIEIANSGKVDGKRYISDKVGCQNKWSIVESPLGLYFIDDIGKSILLFNGQLQDISDEYGFHSWINDRSKEVGVWNPSTFNHVVGYYDKVNGEVLFISKDECLAFSEPLKAFTSFYSYNNVPYFMTIKDKGIWVNKSRSLGGGTSPYYMLWEHNEGEYNRFFDKSEDFYVTVIANPEPSRDKIFDVLEFRSDTFDETGAYQPFDTFDKLETWNEYQSGLQLLSNNKNRPSPLKKKFRIWRVNIPRDHNDGRSRMRNPWLFLKLSKQGSLCHHKTILHDLNVYYTI